MASGLNEAQLNHAVKSMGQERKAVDFATAE